MTLNQIFSTLVPVLFKALERFTPSMTKRLAGGKLTSISTNAGKQTKDIRIAASGGTTVRPCDAFSRRLWGVGVHTRASSLDFSPAFKTRNAHFGCMEGVAEKAV